jgi:Flp pilus assembly protein TadG
MKIISISRKSERGQSLVELALVVTFLMILLLGAVDSGIAFFSWISLRDAAQEGAVFGSINPASDAAIIARVRGSSQTPVNLQDTTLVNGVPRVQVLINDGGLPRCAGNTLTITVLYQYESIFLGNLVIPMGAQVTNTILTPGC